jgi:hypothetical protein
MVFMRLRLCDVPTDLLEEILIMEYSILPTLLAVGININEAEIRDELWKDPEQIILITKSEKGIRGLFRYSNTTNHIFVKSLFINQKMGKVTSFIELGREIYNALLLESLETVESVVQKSNSVSLSLHYKLGFKKMKETEKVIRFKLERVELLATLKRLLRIENY